MKARNPFAKVALTAAIVVFLSTAISQDAFAEHGWRSLTGSWVVNVTPNQDEPPPFTNLATVVRGGAILTTDPIFGAGNGVWKRTGRRDFEIKFLVLVPPVLPPFIEPFPPDTTLTVTSYLTVSKSGDEASGVVTGVYTIMVPDVGQVELFRVDGDVKFTRIEIE